MNQEENKGKDEVPGWDPSLDSPGTEEPNCYSVWIDVVGFSTWLYSTDSAIGLVLT